MPKAKVIAANAFAVMGTLLIAGAAGSARADDLLDTVLQAGVVRIAVPRDFPPFGSIGKDNQPEGYDVDVARLVAKDLGVRLELMPVPSANRITYLQIGKVDLVISSLGVSPDRAKAIAFSNAYAPFFSGVFGDPKVTVKSAADLGGKTIGVTRGTLEETELTKLAPPGTDIRRFDSNEATLGAFIAGEVSLVATGNPVAADAARAHPGRVEKKFVIRDSPVHIGVRRGEYDMLAWVNAFIYYHKKPGGELDQLARKWFGEPLPELPTL
jgi:polar amino acid transport system substrate-binding protein